MKRSMLLSLLAIASCSTLEVKTNSAPNTNFARYRSYAWLPNSDTGQVAQLLRGSPTEQAIKNDVGQQLAAKGITPATMGNPDFMIAYHVTTQQKLDVTNWGYGVGWAGGEDVYQYTQGTLILDFIDPATQHAFWRGYASDVVGEPSQGNPKVGEAVAKMLKQYPSIKSNVATAPPPVSQ